MHFLDSFQIMNVMWHQEGQETRSLDRYDVHMYVLSSTWIHSVCLPGNN